MRNSMEGPKFNYTPEIIFTAAIGTALILGLPKFINALTIVLANNPISR